MENVKAFPYPVLYMLNIFDALENGFDRSYSRDGLLLTAIFFVLTTINSVIASSLIRGTISNYPASGWTLPYSGQLLLPASFIVTLLAAATTIAAMRVFTGRELESAVFTDRIGYALLNIVVGSILYGLIVFTGLLFLVIPGLFLMTALLYWQFRVAVEHENFIEAMRGSWDLTGGDRLRTFGLLVATVLVVMAISLAFSIPMFLGLEMTGFLVVQAGNAFGAVVAVAVLAEGYKQLSG
ncbi:MAG: hypothetical protein ABEJ75_01905 [Candidatus Nanohaloarchaea archaeon]